MDYPSDSSIIISISIISTLLIILSFSSIIKFAFKSNIESNDKQIFKIFTQYKKIQTEFSLVHSIFEIFLISIILSVFYYSISFHQIHIITQILLAATIIFTFSFLFPKFILGKIKLVNQNFFKYSIKISNSLGMKYLNQKLHGSNIKNDLKETPEEVNDLEQALIFSKNNTNSLDEKKLLQGIIKFGNTDVKEIMSPRVGITAINLTNDFTQVLSEVKASTYSRIPIYKDSLDHIEGILYTKDLLPYLSENESFNWTKLVRKALFIPENKKIDNLLKEFQHSKVHIAIVVDEFGGTSGVISLEDILEEIVGNITDEFDKDDDNYKKIDDFNYVFEGKTNIKDVCKILNIEEEIYKPYKGDSETIGGLITEVAGRILKNRESIQISNHKFTILASDKKRIKSIKVTIEK